MHYPVQWPLTKAFIHALDPCGAGGVLAKEQFSVRTGRRRLISLSSFTFSFARPRLRFFPNAMIVLFRLVSPGYPACRRTQTHAARQQHGRRVALGHIAVGGFLRRQARDCHSDRVLLLVTSQSWKTWFQLFSKISSQVSRSERKTAATSSIREARCSSRTRSTADSTSTASGAQRTMDNAREARHTPAKIQTAGTSAACWASFSVLAPAAVS